MRKKTRTMFSRHLLLLLVATFCSVHQVQAMQSPNYANVNRQVSLRANNKTVAQVFAQLEQQTIYRFSYDRFELDLSQLVSVNITSGNMEAVLESLSLQTNLVFLRNGKQIIVSKGEPPVKKVPKHQVMVSGTVTDTTGGVLPGVSVMVEGTNKGVLTDLDGKFKIPAQESDVLLFSMIGFQKQSVQVGESSEITVVLRADVARLGEIVVTALNVKKEKRVVGYAVTSLDGDDFTQARETNIANALVGKVAGVTVVKPVTGAMGSSRVVIRGNGSISGNNQPLYVIDGVPLINDNYGQVNTFYGGWDGGDGISSVNPDNIANITVLKGGTAAALYGARASNGAIIITTKTGKSRKGVGVELNSNFVFNKPMFNNEDDFQYQYGQGIDGNKPTTKEEAFGLGPVSWGAKLDGSDVIQFDGEMRPYSAVKDNIQDFYSGATTFTNTLSLYGGNETTSFRFSASDLNNHDLSPNASLRRNNLSVNVSSKLSEKLTTQLSATYVREQVENRPHAADFSWNGNFSVYFQPTNYDLDNISAAVDAAGNELLFSSNIYFANPYFIRYKMYNGDRKDRLIASLDTRYDLSDHFYARMLMGTDFSYRNSTSVIPPESAIAAGNVGNSSRYDGEFNGQLMFGYDQNFGDFSVNAFAGGNIMKRKNTSLGGSGSNFIVPGFYVLNNTSNSGKSYYLTEKQINSLFASAQIGYKSLVYLALTGRNDWFSTLNPENNNVFYPSASLSYIISEAWNLPSWVSFAKLRGAWAQTGSDSDVSPYAQQITYSFNGTHMGQPLGYIGTGTIPNTNLRPSVSKSYEIGLNARLFNGRLGIDFAWYKRKTVDDILSSQISTTSGFSNVRLNIGEIQNQGIEMLLTATPVQKEGFVWDVSYNLGYNNNEILQLVDGQSSFQAAQSRPGLYGDGGVPAYIFNEIGEPMGIIKGFSYERNENGEIVYDANGLPKKGPLKKLGRGVAPLSMGLNNTFSFGALHVGFLLDGRFGGSVNSATNNYAYLFGLHKNTLEGRENGVIGKGVNESGQPNTVSVPVQQYYSFVANNITEEFVYSSDFIKLRQVVLGFDLPKAWYENIGVQGISLSFVARNLWTIHSRVPIVDPESSYLTGNIQGFEMLALPATRSFGFNLNVKF